MLFFAVFILNGAKLLNYPQNTSKIFHLHFLPKLMLELSKIRPIFHSEADFQYSFAWELNKFMPNGKIFIERPFRIGTVNSRIDIFIEDEGVNYIIELKYKTMNLNGQFDQQDYDLKSHGANDHGGYDFIKDISRIEQFSRNYKNCYGLALFLTNDNKYWSEPALRGSNIVDPAYAQFRLNEGRALTGSVAWPDGTNIGTMKGREASLTLESKYAFGWSDYSNIPNHKNGQFRYLAVEFSRQSE
jgi:hypothetical protein